MKRRFAIIAFTFLMLSGTLISNETMQMIHERVICTSVDFTPSEEYNISSYLDFSWATLDIMFSYLMNYSDGSVFRRGDHQWQIISLPPSLADYYWAIVGLARMYDVSAKSGTPNNTISTMISRAANKMVSLFLDPEYPGFYVNTYSPEEARTTKRAGVQAYAYYALELAESVNSSLDFSSEKQSAIDCLADILYDEENGGFYFFTLRNGSVKVPDYIYEVYPNDGKRLDHLSLGIMALYDAGVKYGNNTLISMANKSIDFMLQNMKEYNQSIYYGMKLAVNRTGGDVIVEQNERPGNVVISDIDAIAMRALLKAYEVTGNSTFLANAETLVRALLEHNWDTENGGWYAETLHGEPYDPLNDKDVKYYKYAEIQFQVVFSLEELYELTDEEQYIQLVIDTLELILANLWDIEDGGFMQNGNRKWETLSQDWQVHNTAVQGQAILALEQIWSYGLPIISYVRINPVSPRPNDEILVSAVISDPDGIDQAYVNYTMTLGNNVTTGILPLLPNPQVKGIFNNTFGYLNDSTRVNFFVFANDSLGNDFIAGSYYFVVREDVFPPTITLRAIYPSEVKEGDEVILEFGTQEFPIHSSIVSCVLFWKVNDGFYQQTNMTLVGVDDKSLVWRINIGSFNGGDVISYFCQATDESGNTGTSIYYKLTVIGPSVTFTPVAPWQVVAVVGLVSAPGFGFAYVWSRRKLVAKKQRMLKKEARRRGRRPRGKGRSRRRRS